MQVQVHIINHTHWDREWFLTSEYTSQWIPNLVKSLEQRSSKKSACHFLLDGQTLVIEDLLGIEPDMETVVRKLVQKGCLTIGPYYTQPDWQLASGELLIRNLQYGVLDMEKLGGSKPVGWLVDTFGHISQAPQIHQLFGIQAIFLWRGVPRLVPYFNWHGADGSQLLAINLFGGYRNLYGVTRVPSVAQKRLTAEVKRLSPFYPTPDIPLFDGYDLEDDPEDPMAFYEHTGGLDPSLELHEATPESFANLISSKNLATPTLPGELNSGKFGATFPGALSARTYLKIMAHDCQHLLYKYCEPVASLAHVSGKAYPAQQFERIGRKLLKNGVHDCICGVSIDQVHEKMAWSYQDIFIELLETLQDSIKHMMRDFSPGEYAFSTNPFPNDCWIPIEETLLLLKTDGIGVWPIDEKIPIDSASYELGQEPNFTWHNEFFDAVLNADGQVRLGDAILGELRVYRENGDAYSHERGDLLGILRPLFPIKIVQRSDRHSILEWQAAWDGQDSWVSACVRIIFDPSPLVRWQVELDSRGTDLSVEMSFNTARHCDVWAGMQFDMVTRPECDIDFLPRQLSPPLEGILLGQRELGEVRDFPFHDLVGISNQQGSSVVFARGLHTYRAEHGILSLTLRRSVEWLTRTDLASRVGDAGPVFYVPDARCERKVHHELAFAATPFTMDSMEMQALNAGFQCPPLVVRSECQGRRKDWGFLQENLPFSSLQIHNGSILALFYNPTSQVVKLAHTYMETDIWGKEKGTTRRVKPKKISLLKLAGSSPESLEQYSPNDSRIVLLNPPQWSVGANHGSPDPVILAGVEHHIADLDQQIDQITDTLSRIEHEDVEDPNRQLLIQHQRYTLQRERLEYQLSLLLNQKKLSFGGNSPPEALSLVDPQIAAVGKELNRLRILRRIYDYVVQALE
jgi:alpha-mannosidase